MYILFALYCLVHNARANFSLTLLHTNDVHARVEEFDQNGNTCTNKQCFGGVARRTYVINELRKVEKNLLLLDAGDQFQGTLWFSVYKGLAIAKFMNYMKYDVMTIGNHEFDNEPIGLVNFINQTEFPVISSNIDATKEPEWPRDEQYNTKSIVLANFTEKIGVIGYTTPDTKWLSKPGKNIKFNDVITSVKKEADRLHKAGVKIIIALGHAGISVDREVAQTVNHVDIVVGGHTNTFLYNGMQPSNDKIEGPYPIVETKPNGKKSLVVQDFTYGKYLGKLKVLFDSNGELMSWSGNPILLNETYQKDENILQLVKQLKGPILNERNVTVATTLVLLEGSAKVCRAVECNLGNLITDAIVSMTRQFGYGDQWASVTLGFWNGGGIRNTIEKNATDPITLEEVKGVLPFGNNADVIEITGKTLWDVFEYSVSALPDELEGRFLQVSGFRVVYNLKKPVGKRVVVLKALCSRCRVPHFEDVQRNETYKVVTSAYLRSGGDGYTMLKDPLSLHPGDLAVNHVIEYMKKHTPLTTPVEGRISFTEEKPCLSSKSSILHTHHAHFLLSIIIIISCKNVKN